MEIKVIRHAPTGGFYIYQLFNSLLISKLGVVNAQDCQNYGLFAKNNHSFLSPQQGKFTFPYIFLSQKTDLLVLWWQIIVIEKRSKNELPY